MFLILLLSIFIQAPVASDCRDALECRRASVDAAARGEYETAHDLAWRAVQKSKPNDLDSMLVLARAQSLSGRPDDALVMLGRIADLGVVPDVTADPAFARVRALSGWPALEAKLAGKPAPSAPSAPLAPAPSAPSVPSAPAPFAPSAPSAPLAPSPETLSFSAPGVHPFALAHDAVSRRFVLGDRNARRLLVVDEVSRNVVNFVSAASAGFYDELTALTIDARRGDLWVASARGEGDQRVSVVHKLQLVSGRTLMEARAADRSGPVRVDALTVTPDGTVYALDTAGARLLCIKPGARLLEPVMRLADANALAAAGDHVLYVAGTQGLQRVDLAARTSTPVKSGEDLGGFESLAWRSGVLLGVERVAGSSLVVRLRIDPTGLHAQPRQILATSPTSTVGALGGDTFYYLSDDGTIRRVPLK